MSELYLLPRLDAQLFYWLTRRLKSLWGCQNHPLARIATSLEGFEGEVGMSGHMLSMFEANRELVLSKRLKGAKAFERINCVKNMSRVRVFFDFILAKSSFHTIQKSRAVTAN